MKFHITFFIISFENPTFKTFGNHIHEKLGHIDFLALTRFLGQLFDLGGF